MPVSLTKEPEEVCTPWLLRSSTLRSASPASASNRICVRAGGVKVSSMRSPADAKSSLLVAPKVRTVGATGISTAANATGAWSHWMGATRSCGATGGYNQVRSGCVHVLAAGVLRPACFAAPRPCERAADTPSGDRPYSSQKTRIGQRRTRLSRPPSIVRTLVQYDDLGHARREAIFRAPAATMRRRG